MHGKLVGLVWQGADRSPRGIGKPLDRARSCGRSDSDAHANVECGVIAETTPDQVRAAFAPPPPPAGLAVVPVARRVSQRSPSPQARRPASRTCSDRPLARRTVGSGSISEVPPDGRSTSRCDRASSPLADLVTLAPFADDTARLVWIATPDGASARTRSRSTNRDPSAPHSRIAARRQVPIARVGWRQRTSRPPSA